MFSCFRTSLPVFRTFAGRAAVVTLLTLSFAQTFAQDAPAPAATQADNPDAKIVAPPAGPPKTKAELTGQAWDLLTNAVNDDKHAEIRIQGLAALGTMGTSTRSIKLIAGAFKDKDVDVRTAAVLAAGQTHDRNLMIQMRVLLDDKEPQVAFTSASTLWKMGDRSGEDILMAVVDGERKAGANLYHGTMHDANKEMHNPAALAKLGAMQGASMLLGPFGYGITAYEYIHKNGGDTARVTAIEEISQNHTVPIRKQLLAALGDKDLLVRTAATKALRGYHDAEVAKALAVLFADPKRPVQLSAAASYLISTGAVPMPRPMPPATP